MASEFSRDAFEKFIELAETRGMVSSELARAWRVAAAKVLPELSPAEAYDLRQADWEGVYRRFEVHNSGNLSPGTISEYRRRVASALTRFMDWQERRVGRSPSTPDERAREAAATSRAFYFNSMSPGAVVRLPEGVVTAATSASALTIPFPLRPDFIAQFHVPSDLSADEVRRITTFLSTLALDYRPV